MKNKMGYLGFLLSAIVFLLLPSDKALVSMDNLKDGEILSLLQDLNQDGRLDLIAVSPRRESFKIFYGNPSGNFLAPEETPGSPSSLQQVDFNGDGFKDVISLHLNKIGIYKRNPDGNLLEQMSLVLDGEEYLFDSFRTGDFNQDGLMDIIALVRDFKTQEVSTMTFTSDGRGVFSLVPQKNEPQAKVQIEIKE